MLVIEVLKRHLELSKASLSENYGSAFLPQMITPPLSIRLNTSLLAFILSITILALAGCIGPGYAAFSPSDAKDHAVLELDMRYLADSTKGECFAFSALNSVPLDKFTDRRIERDSHGKLVKVFVLVRPGRYSVSFGYFKNAMYFAGRDTWGAAATKEINLTARLYHVNGLIEGDSASLWIEDDSGTKIALPEKAQITKNPRTIPLIIPVPL